MAQFGIGDVVQAVDGVNHYEITKTQGGCYRLLCTHFAQQEMLSCDVTCYSYGSELWLNSENDNVLKLVGNQWKS